ncbi:MAG: methylmalonyl-CoA mutase, partial [Actinomycetia bacterium]|nr:methylmalonyl-CoA mutase [Actinomycetes bacterium]
VTGDEAVVVRENRSTTETEAEQIDRVRKLRASRDSVHVERCLDAIRRDARAGTNTLPSVIDAIRGYATVGEVSSALAEVWGWHPTRKHFDT